jgi:hypothetical protein
MLERDGATEVVVPIALRGPFLVTGAPATPAASFFAQVLGTPPLVQRGAWVFRVPRLLAPARFAPSSVVRTCERMAVARPALLGPCILREAAP